MSHLEHNEVLGRLIRKGGWQELSEGTVRLLRRAIDNGDAAGIDELADFLLGEFRIIYDIYSGWFPHTRRYLTDQGMSEAEVEALHQDIRARLAPWHEAVSRPREEVIADVTATVEAIKTGASRTLRHASLDRACSVWRDLHDSEVDQLAGLFNEVITRFGEPALRQMYEGWVIGDWFAKRYQRFDISKMPWETASWLLIYLGFEGMHGHFAGAARDGTIDYAEDEEKVTLSFAPCGSGGRSMQGEPRDGLPPLSDGRIGFAEMAEAHDFTWNETGICGYCAHCCILHENLPIAAFGYPVRVTVPPTAPLTSESRCSWTVYKDLRAIPDWAYTRVGGRKPPAHAPLGSAGKAERDAILAAEADHA